MSSDWRVKLSRPRAMHLMPRLANRSVRGRSTTFLRTYFQVPLSFYRSWLASHRVNEACSSSQLGSTSAED